jgi:hypothetical protein
MIGAESRLARLSIGAGTELSIPFALEAAFGQENHIVDSLSDRGHGPYLEDPSAHLLQFDRMRASPASRYRA